jgi:hypothetical protein
MFRFKLNFMEKHYMHCVPKKEKRSSGRRTDKKRLVPRYGQLIGPMKEWEVFSEKERPLLEEVA